MEGREREKEIDRQTVKERETERDTHRDTTDREGLSLVRNEERKGEFGQNKNGR